MHTRFIAGSIIMAIIVGLGYVLLQRESQEPLRSFGEGTRISTSFYPLYYFTTAIVRGQADVFSLTPAGVEPHDFEPTAQDIARIEHSKVLFLLGGGFEPWAADIEKNLAKKVTIVSVGETFMTKGREEDGIVQKDPHVWLDPKLAREMVRRMTDELVRTSPSRETAYKDGAQRLTDQLTALDKAYKTGLETCERRDFVTSHAAFGYLAETYQLNQIAIAGFSPEEEPSPKRLAEISSLVREKGISYIFFESLVSPKLADTIAKETGAQTLVLDPIEGLSDDQIEEGKTYFTQMEDNLKNLRLALSCT